MEEQAEDVVEKKKTDSKKFVVWLVWLILVLCNIGLDVVIIIVTKNIGTEIIDLSEKILSWFFAVSMMYLGMNVTQKVAYMAKDVLSGDK